MTKIFLICIWSSSRVAGSQILKPLEFPGMMAIKVSFVVLMKVTFGLNPRAAASRQEDQPHDYRVQC